MELFCSDGATLATSTDWLSAFPRASENAMAGTNSRADLAVLYCDLGRLQEGLAALESTLVGIFRGGRRRGALVLTCARAVIGRSDGPVRLELRGAYGRTVVRREPYRTVVRHRAPYYGRVVVRSGTRITDIAHPITVWSSPAGLIGLSFAEVAGKRRRPLTSAEAEGADRTQRGGLSLIVGNLSCRRVLNGLRDPRPFAPHLAG